MQPLLTVPCHHNFSDEVVMSGIGGIDRDDVSVED
jgi:hypothetical protein